MTAVYFEIGHFYDVPSGVVGDNGVQRMRVKFTGGADWADGFMVVLDHGRELQGRRVQIGQWEHGVRMNS